MKKILIVIAILSLPFCAGAQTIIFSSGMGSSASADFNVVKTPDSTAEWGYNWSAEAVDATTGYTTVPASPGGDTTGLKVTVNNIDDPTIDYKEGVTIYAKTAPSTNYYDVECDFFGAYTIPLSTGGTGSTEHCGIVIQSAGTKLCTIRDVDLSTVDPTTTGYPGGAVADQDGLAFGFVPDAGDALSDFYCFMPSTRTGTPNTDTSMAQVGTWTDSDPLPPAAGNLHQKLFTTAPYSTAFTWPAGRLAADQTPGYIWNHIKMEVRNDKVSCYINGVKFVEATSTLTDKKIGIIVTDPYISVSTPPEQSFFMIDNFKITQQSAPTPTPTPIPVLNARNWELFQ